MTTLECVHLVTGSDFWSCNKNDSHAIRSAIAESDGIFVSVLFLFCKLLRHMISAWIARGGQ